MKKRTNLILREEELASNEDKTSPNKKKLKSGNEWMDRPFEAVRFPRIRTTERIFDKNHPLPNGFSWRAAFASCVYSKYSLATNEHKRGVLSNICAHWLPSSNLT